MTGLAFSPSAPQLLSSWTPQPVRASAPQPLGCQPSTPRIFSSSSPQQSEYPALQPGTSAPQPLSPQSHSSISPSAAQPLNRRDLLKACLITAAAVSLGGSTPAYAAKEKVWGAAELDALMYVCGATGKMCPAKTKQIIPPARTLQQDLGVKLSKLPTVAMAKASALDPSQLTEESSNLGKQFYAEFQKKSKFSADDLSNQYATDFNSYIQYRAAKNLLQKDSERIAFQQAMGQQVLLTLREIGVKAGKIDAPSQGLEKVLEGCDQILQKFKESGFIEKYTLDGSDYDSRYWGPDSPPTSVTVTFDSPATLGGCLIMTQEAGSFRPDYVGQALVAYFEECKVNAEYTPYFVDKEYRPNPDDYQPSQVLGQFNLRPK